MKTRTRFAPSPTGFMHIGNLRTAIFEYLVAKHDKGDFILRIEDTDQERKVDGAIDFIYDTLKLCHFEIDEGPNNEGDCGPYIQSERKDIYLKYAMELVSKKEAYYCFCTESELTHQREIATSRGQAFMYNGKCRRLTEEMIKENLENNVPYVIRQRIPRSGKTEVEDLVYGKITVDNSVLEDQILIKSDGFPTYNFANVVDDHLMGITHVIRGHEYLSQTPKYNLLYKAFGWEPPKYIHVAMVLGEDGNKLSKRNGDASFMDLYNDGFLPAAIVNYLVLLGWSPNNNQEIFSMDELILNFDPKRISKSDSKYDIKKLEWVNAHYIKAMNEEDYLKFVKPYLASSYDISNRSDDFINHLLLIYKDHLNYGSEIKELVSMFFNNDIKIDDMGMDFIKSDASIPNTIKVFKEEISKISEWTVDNISAAINNTKEISGAKGKLLYMPIRIKTTGLMHGPELPDTLYLLGKETVIERLNNENI